MNIYFLFSIIYHNDFFNTIMVKNVADFIQDDFNSLYCKVEML